VKRISIRKSIRTQVTRQISALGKLVHKSQVQLDSRLRGNDNSRGKNMAKGGKSQGQKKGGKYSGNLI
jgi:hypothetical protein